MSLFADDMILYIENPKESIIKLPEVINQFRKLAGHKIYSQSTGITVYSLHT